MAITDLYTVEKHEKGSECQIKDENGELIDLFITVVGLDSKAFRSGFIEGRRDMLTNDDPLDSEALTLAKSSISWRGEIIDSLEFSEESIKNLYLNAPYIANQINLFIGDRANFTEK